MAISKQTRGMANIRTHLSFVFFKTAQDLCHNLRLLSRARVVKLVDAGDSKSPAARRAGSIPAPGTIGSFYRPDSIARLPLL
jgi:hypothetical protein